MANNTRNNSFQQYIHEAFPAKDDKTPEELAAEHFQLDKKIIFGMCQGKLPETTVRSINAHRQVFLRKKNQKQSAKV